ncbi:MAG: hypothetical protein ABJG15_13185 [Hyphomonadaceae bacterium]
MSAGPIFFAFAVIPVLILMWSLQNIRQCLSDSRKRRRVLMELPLLIIIAPLLITGIMLVEANVDPEFIERSFENSEGWKPLDILFFAYDQTFRGAFFDVVETFKIQVSPLVHKCDSILFCTSTLIYRTSIGLATSSMLLALYLTISDKFKSKKSEETESGIPE